MHTTKKIKAIYSHDDDDEKKIRTRRRKGKNSLNNQLRQQNRKKDTRDGFQQVSHHSLKKQMNGIATHT